MERTKRERIFNALQVLDNKISVSDIEGLKMLKLSQHPQIILQIEVMETKAITYQTLADSIKPLVERKDGKGKDAFDVSDCPPERLFGIFNSTFDDDQKSSYADYMQLSMQSQFNK